MPAFGLAVGLAFNRPRVGASVLPTLPAGITWTGGGVYSLNRLVDGYAGNAITLIRASDSDQEDFGFAANGAFDESAYTTWVSGTTAKVVTWYDQSGNGYDATQTTDANRPEFKINVHDRPCVYFRDADFTPQLTLNLPSGITNKLCDMTQITVGRCVDEPQANVTGPVWPAFGVGTLYSDFGASGGVIEITSSSSSLGFYDRSLNGNPVVYSSLYPSTSRMEAVGFFNTGVGSNAADQRYITSTFRNAETRTGAITVWKNAGVAQMPVGGKLGSRGDGGQQSQGEVQAMILARGGSISQTDEMMTAVKESFALGGSFERLWIWAGDSLAAGYEGGYDYKGRSPGVLCSALTERHLVLTYAKAGKRFDQLDTDCANASTGIDHWLSASESKMPYAAYVFAALGTNDLNATANGGSAASLATLQSRCNTFIANRKASGAAAVIISTIVEAGSYITNDTTRLDYNTWVRANLSDADGYVDLAALNWTGKKQGDGVHWTEAGNAMAAQAVADYINAPPIPPP